MHSISSATKATQDAIISMKTGFAYPQIQRKPFQAMVLCGWMNNNSMEAIVIFSIKKGENKLKVGGKNSKEEHIDNNNNNNINVKQERMQEPSSMSNMAIKRWYQKKIANKFSFIFVDSHVIRFLFSFSCPPSSSRFILLT